MSARSARSPATTTSTGALNPAIRSRARTWSRADNAARGQALDITPVNALCDLEADGTETGDGDTVATASRTHSGVPPSNGQRVLVSC